VIAWTPTRDDGKKIISVKPDSDPPWCRLSPDYQAGQIPVPGLRGMYSDCVTGVMEGLKLIGPKGKPGKINPAYFSGPGRLRPVGDKEWFLGYSFKGQRIDFSQAWDLIFVPTYLWTLQNKCPDLVGNLKKISKDKDLWIWNDNESQDHNPGILLVAFINGEL